MTLYLCLGERWAEEFCRELLADRRICTVEALVNSAGSFYLIAEGMKYELCFDEFCREFLADHQTCAVGTFC